MYLLDASYTVNGIKARVFTFILTRKQLVPLEVYTRMAQLLPPSPGHSISRARELRLLQNLPRLPHRL